MVDLQIPVNGKLFESLTFLEDENDTTRTRVH